MTERVYDQDSLWVAALRYLYVSKKIRIQDFCRMHNPSMVIHDNITEEDNHIFMKICAILDDTYLTDLILTLEMNDTSDMLDPASHRQYMDTYILQGLSDAVISSDEFRICSLGTESEIREIERRVVDHYRSVLAREFPESSISASRLL